MTSQTADGSLPIHLACQYSTDPTMVATLLYYNRCVINARRNDGLTALHMVASRNEARDKKLGLIPLSEDTQIRMIRLLLDHGADRNLQVEGYRPVDLIAENRNRARGIFHSGEQNCRRHDKRFER